MHRATVLYMTLHPPVRSYPWFFQNLLRARVSRIVRLPVSLDFVRGVGIGAGRACGERVALARMASLGANDRGAQVMTDVATARTPQQWCIVTCEYPPMVGGVSDHTFLLAGALARAGDIVDVWTPPGAAPPPAQPGVTVHLLPSLFKLDALRVLRRVLRQQRAETRVLVQYVPTGYGWRMMNVAFALLLFSQRRRGLEIYFHEVGFIISHEERFRRKVVGAVHVVMNWLSVRAATRIFVAIPEWQKQLEKLGVRAAAGLPVVTWVPVSSNVPDVVDASETIALRASLLGDRARVIIGHFGTFGRFHSAVLIPAFEQILDDDRQRIALLVGRNSTATRDTLVSRRPDLAPRVIATGGLLPGGVSAHLSTCDILLQPYDDGASARRGSLMAGLALGLPIVSNRGPVTGAIWTSRSPVYLAQSAQPADLARAVSELLSNDALRVLDRRSCANAAPGEVRAEPRCDASQGRRESRWPSAGYTAQRFAGAPRVLMFHTTLPTPGRKPGGVEIAVHRLANALHDLGVNITVASLTPPPADARYAHRHLFPWFPSLRDFLVGRLVLLPLLLNTISFSDADVVHFHGDDWFVMRRGRATVRTLHGSALREAQRATRWQRSLVQYMVYPFERLSAAIATIAVAVSHDTAKIHGIERIIGNGVDPDLFRPGAKSPSPLVLYLGTWSGRKRGQWMYELFTSQISTVRPDVELRFIADVAPPPHPRVRFERFPTDEALAAAYREAWVFALPSTYEGFGIPYLEAMASGTAVVATVNAGAAELIETGRDGLLVEDDEFADALLSALGDGPAREEMAARGFARSRGFTWPDIARAYLAVYEEAVHSKAKAVRPAS